MSYKVSTSDKGKNYLKIPDPCQSHYFKPNVWLEVALQGLVFSYPLFKTGKVKNLFSIINYDTNNKHSHKIYSKHLNVCGSMYLYVHIFVCMCV